MLGIIDAKLYEKIETYPRDIQALFYEQLSHCSTLFVNKIDIADFNQVARLLRHLGSLMETQTYTSKWRINVKHIVKRETFRC